jgi:hypothetical protein
MPNTRQSRILLHPGFHKTGTSSIQQFLWTNRVALAPHLGVLLLGQLRDSVRLCMAYSRDQNPLRLADLVEIMDDALADAGLAPGQLGGRDLVISCEGLAGNMPGGSKVADYAAAPVTCAFLTGYLSERFPDAEVCVVLGTRDAEPWLNSVWRHHVVAQRLRLAWPDFRRNMRSVANLFNTVKNIGDAVAPAPVYTLPLEQAAKHAKGPGGALVELCHIPAPVRAALIPVAHSNRGPEGQTVNACLSLNQSDLPQDEVRDRKAALVAHAANERSRTGA